MSATMLTIIATLATIPVAYLGIRLATLALRPSPHTTSTTRAAILFTRGIAPTLGAIVIAAGIILPAFIRFEPPHDGERVGAAILLLAAVGAAQVLAAIVRAIRILRLSHTITTSWRRQARPLARHEWGLPALEIDATFPVVAVSGLVKPTLFIDRRIITACSDPELAAIAAHERAHVRCFDNLRRLLLAACAGTRSADAAAWRDAAEQAADDRAAENPARAVELASALLKLARLAPARSLEATALSTIHDGSTLELRVRRLLVQNRERPQRRTTVHVLTVALLLGGIMALNWSAVLNAVHSHAESVIEYLR